MGAEKVLLVVSFGTSKAETREKTIGGIERAMQSAFPDYDVRRAFTSKRILAKIAQTEGLVIEDPSAAMERAWQEGCQELIVQPTHVMPGIEYENLLSQVEAFTDKFARIRVGYPLLTASRDQDGVIDALVQETKAYDDGQTAVILIGHGTNHEANKVYAAMQKRLTERGYQHYLIGTVEETAEGFRARMQEKAGRYQRIVLIPMLIVAGEHAAKDIGGDKPTSWKSVFEAAGYEVVVLPKGLGEYAKVQQLFVEHTREIM